MRHLDEIIIHCSATQRDWMRGSNVLAKRDEIGRWHKAKRWRDIGYHYLIDRDGSGARGRPVSETGAHTRGRNKTSIGICLVGGHGSSATDKFHDHFTPAQDRALRELIIDLRLKYPSITAVSGHNQYANKACPGFYVPIWLNQPPAPVEPTATGFAAILQAILSLFKGDKR